jgi:CheY-like chemotaxis protein
MLAPSVILIVEDEAGERQAIGRYVSVVFPSARVITTESGETALALADRLTPRVVLLDLRLGGMQGFEFARRLRERPRSRGTAIVALTGDTSTATLLRAEEAGFAAFLRKPDDLDRLETVLRPFVDDRRAAG